MAFSHTPQVGSSILLLDKKTNKFKTIVDEQGILSDEHDNEIELVFSHEDGISYDKKTVKMRSFVGNYGRYLFQILSDNSARCNQLDLKCTDGASLNNFGTDNWSGFNNTTDNSYGILLGTNGTAVAKNDFSLLGVPNAGSNAGELLYSAQQYSTYNADPNSLRGGDTPVQVLTSRIFHNNTSTSQFFSEVGLVCRYSVATPYKYVLMARDLLNSGNPFEIPPGKKLTITYKFLNNFSNNYLTNNATYHYFDFGLIKTPIAQSYTLIRSYDDAYCNDSARDGWLNNLSQMKFYWKVDGGNTLSSARQWIWIGKATNTQYAGWIFEGFAGANNVAALNQPIISVSRSEADATNGIVSDYYETSNTFGIKAYIDFMNVRPTQYEFNTIQLNMACDRSGQRISLRHPMYSRRLADSIFLDPYQTVRVMLNFKFTI